MFARNTTCSASFRPPGSSTNDGAVVLSAVTEADESLLALLFVEKAASAANRMLGSRDCMAVLLSTDRVVKVCGHDTAISTPSAASDTTGHGHEINDACRCRQKSWCLWHIAPGSSGSIVAFHCAYTPAVTFA